MVLGLVGVDDLFPVLVVQTAQHFVDLFLIGVPLLHGNAEIRGRNVDLVEFQLGLGLVVFLLVVEPAAGQLIPEAGIKILRGRVPVPVGGPDRLAALLAANLGEGVEDLVLIRAPGVFEAATTGDSDLRGVRLPHALDQTDQPHATGFVGGRFQDLLANGLFQLRKALAAEPNLEAGRHRTNGVAAAFLGVVRVDHRLLLGAQSVQLRLLVLVQGVAEPSLGVVEQLQVGTQGLGGLAGALPGECRCLAVLVGMPFARQGQDPVDPPLFPADLAVRPLLEPLHRPVAYLAHLCLPLLHRLGVGGDVTLLPLDLLLDGLHAGLDPIRVGLAVLHSLALSRVLAGRFQVFLFVLGDGLLVSLFLACHGLQELPRPLFGHVVVGDDPLVGHVADSLFQLPLACPNGLPVDVALDAGGPGVGPVLPLPAQPRDGALGVLEVGSHLVSGVLEDLLALLPSGGGTARQLLLAVADGLVKRSLGDAGRFSHPLHLAQQEFRLLRSPFVAEVWKGVRLDQSPHGGIGRLAGVLDPALTEPLRFRHDPGQDCRDVLLVDGSDLQLRR